MKKRCLFLLFLSLAFLLHAKSSKKSKKNFKEYQYRFLQEKLSEAPEPGGVKKMTHCVASGSIAVVVGFATMVTINRLLTAKPEVVPQKPSLKRAFLKNLREMIRFEMGHSTVHDDGGSPGRTAEQFHMGAQADISFPELLAKTARDTFIPRPAQKSKYELWWITVRNMLVFLSTTVLTYFLLRKYWFYETPFRDTLTEFVVQWPEYQCFTPTRFHEQFDAWHEQIQEEGRLALSEQEAERAMMELDMKILEDMHG